MFSLIMVSKCCRVNDFSQKDRLNEGKPCIPAYEKIEMLATNNKKRLSISLRRAVVYRLQMSSVKPSADDSVAHEPLSRGR